MEVSKAAIAERIAALPPARREQFLLELKRKGVRFERLPIVARGERIAEVCSPAQLRLWFLWQLDPESTAYHIAAGLRLLGALSVPALRSAFETLVDRHESLRTVFRASSSEVADQVIQTAGRFELQELDVSAESRPVAEARAAEEARRIAHTSFDLTTGPLFRVGLIRLASEEHVLVLVMHHIVSDGWSIQIIVEEFVELYRARLENREAALKPLSIQYADYAVWQRNWLEAGERERQLAYWRRQLGGEYRVPALATDHPRSSESKYHAARHSLETPAGLTEGLHRCAREHRATLFTVLLAGLQVLLHRYTGMSAIPVGTTNANRNRPETQGVVGFFVNTQVLRSHVQGTMTLDAVVDHVRETVLGAQEHQDLPFDQLVDALRPRRAQGQQPLFPMLLDHQRKNHERLKDLPGLSLQRYELGSQGALFDLWMNTAEQPDGTLTATVSYARELFEPDTIARLGTHYMNVLRAMAEQPHRLVGDVELPGLAELRQSQDRAVDRARWHDDGRLESPERIEEQHTPLGGASPAIRYEAPMGAAEEVLASIWSDILRIERVGRHDNFFELGGDSLQLARVLNRLRERSDLLPDVRLTDLVQEPTVAGLIRRKGFRASAQPLVRLNEVGGASTLFCIHQAAGVVFSYFPLAQALRGSQTVYGMTCRSLTQSSHRDESVLAMARDYARVIVESQPEGPYLLFGHSSGGLLAAWIAKRLEEEGRTVAFLGLVEPFVPGAEPIEADDLRDDLRDYLKSLAPSVTLDDGWLSDVTFGEPDSAESVELVRRCVAQVVNDHPSLSRELYLQMNADELATSFLVRQRMARLSAESPLLPKLKVVPHCWWVPGRASSVRQALREQVGATCDREDIDTDHERLIRDPRLVEDVVEVLGGLSR